MRFGSWVLVSSSLLAVLLGSAGAADRPVRAERLIVADPDPGDPAARTVTARAREKASPEPLVGDPTLGIGAGGAVLEIVANGADGTWQTFGLAQGTAATGDAFWRSPRPGMYRYDDLAHEQGPVRRVLIKKAASGTLHLRVQLRGPGIEVRPPNPGTDGLITLALAQGDRYCAQYGGDGISRNRDGRRWSIGRVQAKGCGTPPEPSGELLALSYNVAGLPEGISGSHPEANTPIISPLLNAYDLVVVQESWQTPDPNPLAPLRVYHELLAADATHPYKTVSAPLPLGTDPRRPDALVSDGLNTFSRFPFTSLQREPWTECWQSAADCLALKGFTLVRTTFAPGVTVDVYDLHMEAGGDPEDDQLRDAGVTQLAAFINAHSAGRPVLVGGDFNLHTDAEPDSTQFQRLLAETGLVDVCAALGCPQPGRIDKWLFRSAGSITIEPLSWRFETDVFVDSLGEPLSDHDALAVRFRWTVGP